MMRLNNKGMTIIEVLICFVIISVVMMSLFSTVAAFNEKRIQESYRAKMYSFKNEWTSRIQEDFIKKGLSFAKVTRAIYDGGTKYTVDCTLKTGEKRQLVIYQRFTLTPSRLNGNYNKPDRFYIEYGPPGELFHEELPDLGKTNWLYTGNKTDEPKDANKYIVGKNTAGEKGFCDGELNNQCYSQDFQINNIQVRITNEDEQTSSDHVITIYIGFTHPNFGTKYSIDIVCPIDFQGSNADTSTRFPTTSNASEKKDRILDIRETTK